MVDAEVVATVRRYLDALRREHSIDVVRGVVFGSRARAGADKWSDIDLVVIAPSYDRAISREDASLLWRVAGRTDSRIEPIPCGERQWTDDQSSAILEIARREGEVVTPEKA